MRGEEKGCWWEHGRAGAHFPWETALPRDTQRAEGSPADTFPGGAGGMGAGRATAPSALGPNPPACQARGEIIPTGKAEALGRAVQRGTGSSGHCWTVRAKPRQAGGGGGAGRGPGNCNSLWMGCTGRGGERSQASTSINLPSGRQAGAAAAPRSPCRE